MIIIIYRRCNSRFVSVVVSVSLNHFDYDDHDDHDDDDDAAVNDDDGDDHDDDCDDNCYDYSKCVFDCFPSL